MSLVTLKEILQEARSCRYAVPMFDVANIAMIRAAVEVAEEENSPVILAAVEPDLNGSAIEYWSSAARHAAFRSQVPVAIILDHGATAELCVRCAQAGFSGVMLDASCLSFEENIAAVREVADQMHRRGVSVEAELGHVGDAQAIGGEGALTGNAGAHNVYTDPALVAEFVERSGCDALAVSIGTAHGIYRTAPELEIELLRKINAVSPVPLVLHGGSGTPAEQLRAAIENGIAKINICAEVMHAWHQALLDELGEKSNLSSLDVIVCRKPEAAVREVMRSKIRLFGSNRR